MKATDRSILVGLALAGLIAAFWFVVLSPKREEAAKLDDDVAALKQAVSDQEQLVADAMQAEADFDQNYRQLVVLGKAVPEDEDTSSLFVQLQAIAQGANVQFDAIELNAGAASTPTAAPAAEETPVDPPAQSGSEPAAPPEQTAAAPTEAAAAGLPIGATVGPAGLSVMPYTINLRGSFFELADFFAGIDQLVRARGGRDLVDGRLITIDGFGLTGSKEEGFETLSASVAVTTFVTPAEQGLTGGATPGGPPIAVPTLGTSTPTAPTP
jgi:Tfp pilus assembly protein PilO